MTVVQKQENIYRIVTGRRSNSPTPLNKAHGLHVSVHDFMFEVLREEIGQVVIHRNVYDGKLRVTDVLSHPKELQVRLPGASVSSCAAHDSQRSMRIRCNFPERIISKLFATPIVCETALLSAYTSAYPLETCQRRPVA